MKKIPYNRGHHRERNHQHAHADPSAGPPATIHHPLVARGHDPIITTTAGLEELIAHLRGVGVFAYDSEFIGELTYLPRLCLIQVATTERVSLIDPLAEIDLTPFWDLIADPAVEKIVHAGQQDVEPVFRFSKKPPANMFDTQIAAGFIALPYPLSLSKLVAELAGAKLGKGLTFSHWDHRPLSSMQLRYAADDVRYLPLVHREMLSRLADNGHESWARQQCAESLCEPSVYRFNPDEQYLRIRGVGTLKPPQLAILRELTIWRDGAAQTEDVPPRTLLRDEILLDMARSPVKSVEDLPRVRGLPRPVEDTYGHAMVDAVKAALSMPASAHPAPSRDGELPPVERFRIDALWATAQRICYDQKIDPAVVASRQSITDFHAALAGRDASIETHPLMSGWRRAALGERLAKAVNEDQGHTRMKAEG